MNNYPVKDNEEADNHKSRHTLRIVVIIVILIIVLFGIVGYINRPTTGTVTAVNNTSITIKPSGTSTNKTYRITNKTLMGLPGASSSYLHPKHFDSKDIHVGETVVVNKVIGSNQAQAVTVKP